MKRSEVQVQRSTVSLTPKIEAYEDRLYQTKKEVGNFVKTSEGFLFKFIGLDGLIGLIPVAGAVYTAFGGFWLLSQSGRVRADFADKATIVALTIVDIVIGVFPGVGDVADFFFRSHSWNGRRLIDRADHQLALIDRARTQVAQGLNPNLKELEEVLLHNV